MRKVVSRNSFYKEFPLFVEIISKLDRQCRPNVLIPYIFDFLLHAPAGNNDNVSHFRYGCREIGSGNLDGSIEVFCELITKAGPNINSGAVINPMGIPWR